MTWIVRIEKAENGYTLTMSDDESTRQVVCSESLEDVEESLIEGMNIASLSTLRAQIAFRDMCYELLHFFCVQTSKYDQTRLRVSIERDRSETDQPGEHNG